MFSTAWPHTAEQWAFVATLAVIVLVCFVFFGWEISVRLRKLDRQLVVLLARDRSADEYATLTWLQREATLARWLNAQRHTYTRIDADNVVALGSHSVRVPSLSDTPTTAEVF